MERRSLIKAIIGLPLLGSGCKPAGGPGGPAAGVVRIGGFQMVPNPAPDAVRDGFVKALEEAGYVEGKNVRFDFQNAQGEIPNTQLIAEKFVSDGVNMIFAIGTPPLQAAVKAAPKSLPVVFAFASDPWGAGAGKTPADHQPNCTGTIGTNPVGAEVELIKQVVPGIRRVGLIFNPGEPNSLYEAKLFKEAAAKEGLEVVDQAVAGPPEVLQAAQSVAAKGVQAFAKVGDYATITAFDSLVKVGRQSRIPVFSVDKPDIDAGAVATIGWSYIDDGYAAGQLAVRILKGESPAGIPFQPLTKKELAVNLKAARELGLTVPRSVVEKADRVVE